MADDCSEVWGRVLHIGGAKPDSLKWRDELSQRNFNALERFVIAQLHHRECDRCILASPAPYRALATSAIVFHTTEEVLESTVGGAAAGLFDWLALRPFFQTRQLVRPELRGAVRRSI